MVENKYTFAKVLEKELNDNNYKYEVINCSVPGYDTKHEYYNLMEKGLKYQPDIIILAFCLNDIGNPLSTTGLKYIGKKKLKFRIYNFFRKYIYIFNWVATKYRYLLVRMNYISRNEDLQDTLIDRNDKNWIKNWKYLSLIQNACLKNNIELIILIIPYKIQISKKFIDEYSKRYGLEIPLKVLECIPQKVLKNYLLKERIHYIDYTEFFRNSNKDLYAYEDWVHLNKNGHNLIAEVLCNYILELYRK